MAFFRPTDERTNERPLRRRASLASPCVGSWAGILGNSFTASVSNNFVFRTDFCFIRTNKSRTIILLQIFRSSVVGHKTFCDLILVLCSPPTLERTSTVSVWLLLSLPLRRLNLYLGQQRSCAFSKTVHKKRRGGNDNDSVD